METYNVSILNHEDMKSAKRLREIKPVIINLPTMKSSEIEAFTDES